MLLNVSGISTADDGIFDGGGTRALLLLQNENDRQTEIDFSFLFFRISIVKRNASNEPYLRLVTD